MHDTTGRAGVGAIKTSASGAASAGVLQQAGTQVAQAVNIQTHRFGNFLKWWIPKTSQNHWLQY